MTPADPEDGTKAKPAPAEDAEVVTSPPAAAPVEAEPVEEPAPATTEDAEVNSPPAAAPVEAEPVAQPAPATIAAAPLEAEPVAEPAPRTIAAAPVEAEAEEAGESPRRQRRWPWLALLLLVLAALLGMALGVGVVLRGRSFGTQLPADQAARPTFVIAAPPSPSPSGSPRSLATPVAASTNTEEYTVEAGDTLRSIAQRVYGDPAQWPRIYDANRETIGPDPDTLNAQTKLRIPRP